MRSACYYIDMLKDPKEGNKPKMPETDLARIIAAHLEPTTIVCHSKVMHFDGNRWLCYDAQHGASNVVKETARKVFTPTQASMKHGKWEHNMQTHLTPAFVKSHTFVTVMRMEVLADLFTADMPEFDDNRQLLACNNGVTLDTSTGKLYPTHPTMLNTKCLSWPLTEWEHPAASEYRRLVRDITAHW